MTNTTPSPPLPERVERLEVDRLDVKIALNALIDHSFQSEQRMTEAIERLAAAQVQTLQIVETMQSEIRGIQTENRRIIQRVFGEEAEGEA